MHSSKGASCIIRQDIQPDAGQISITAFIPPPALTARYQPQFPPRRETLLCAGLGLAPYPICWALEVKLSHLRAKVRRKHLLLILNEQHVSPGG
jgi:hypothetical protein